MVMVVPLDGNNLGVPQRISEVIDFFYIYANDASDWIAWKGARSLPFILLQGFVCLSWLKSTKRSWILDHFFLTCRHICLFQHMSTMHHTDSMRLQGVWFLLVWDWPLFWARFLIVVVCLLCAEGAFIWTHWSFNVFHPFSTHCFNTFRIVQDFCEKLDIQAAAGLLWTCSPMTRTAFLSIVQLTQCSPNVFWMRAYCAKHDFSCHSSGNPLSCSCATRLFSPVSRSFAPHVRDRARVPGLTKQKGFASEHLVKPCDILWKSSWSF